jgi:hypothetical protein
MMSDVVYLILIAAAGIVGAVIGYMAGNLDKHNEWWK